MREDFLQVAFLSIFLSSAMVGPDLTRADGSYSHWTNNGLCGLEVIRHFEIESYFEINIICFYS